MGERNSRPTRESAEPAKQAEGVATGNEKLQDEGQRDGHVVQERHDGTFVGGKDRLGPSRAGGSPEGHVVEEGTPKDLVDEDKVTGQEKGGGDGSLKGGL